MEHHRFSLLRTAVAFAVLVASVTACGAGTTGGSSTGAPPTQAPVTPTDTPTASPTPSGGVTPIPISTDSVFAAVDSGVDVFSHGGALEDTFATSSGADEIGIDDSGNVYAFVDNSDFSIGLARYAAGEDTPNATYAPTSARAQLVLVGRNGTLVAAGAGSDGSGNATSIYDVWDPGTSGAPSRTITYANENLVTLGGTVGGDGTLYLPYDNASGQVRYDVISPGTATVSRTIVETIAPANSTFAPNVMAVGTDGTLYVGEWTYETTDTNKGLYVYPPGGAETKVTTGAPNPTGIDFDASGNVYVANSNATVEADATLSADTVHTLTQFTASAATLTRQVSTGFDDPQNLAVDLDGTAYLADYQNADQTSGTIAVISPSATAASTFAANLSLGNIVLYDGTRVRSARTFGATSRTSGRTFRRRDALFPHLRSMRGRL